MKILGHTLTARERHVFELNSQYHPIRAAMMMTMGIISAMVVFLLIWTNPDTQWVHITIGLCYAMSIIA